LILIDRLEPFASGTHMLGGGKMIVKQKAIGLFK
jgi:hypothetical protein